ncbi:MAG: Ig-like domain-containing protein [Lachnospiraceae bacterium]
MFKNTKAKLVAAILALAMIVTAIMPSGMNEVQAASKNKVMEAKVDYSASPQFGNESQVYMKLLLASEEVTYGKKYSLNMKIYVPEAFMSEGNIWIYPTLYFWSGEDYDVCDGCACYTEGFSFNKSSDSVTRYNDFYVIDAKMPMNQFTVGFEGDQVDYLEGSGKIYAFASIIGTGKKYKGSIFFDDLSLVADEGTIVSNDFENGDIGDCFYYQNTSKEVNTPKVVSFSGKALEVSQTSLTVKKGKKVTIKATATPNSKITYTSSNKKVATVTSKGVVKGIKKGKATITVKANGKTIKVKVTVK